MHRYPRYLVRASFPVPNRLNRTPLPRAALSPLKIPCLGWAWSTADSCPKNATPDVPFLLSVYTLNFTACPSVDTRRQQASGGRPSANTLVFLSGAKASSFLSPKTTLLEVDLKVLQRD